MKTFKSISLWAVVILAIFIFASCVTDPVESCEEDTTSLCVPVSVCCTDDDCTYTVNGVEYSSMQEAVNNISCVSVVINGKSTTEDGAIMAKLQELTEMAKLKQYE